MKLRNDESLIKSKFVAPIYQNLRWFDFLTIQSFALACGLTDTYATATISRFVNKHKYLKSGFSNRLNRKVFLPTSKFKKLLGEQNFPHLDKLNTKPQKIPTKNIEHDYFLMLQVIKTFGIDDVFDFNDLLHPPRKTPDFIIKKDNKRIAIELENSVKNINNLHLFYANHVVSMFNNAWDKVYIFATNNQTFNAHEKILNLKKLLPVKSGKATKYPDGTTKKGKLFVTTSDDPNGEILKLKKKDKAKFILKKSDYDFDFWHFKDF